MDEKTEYSFTVTSVDAAGNSSSSDEVVFDTAHQGGGVSSGGGGINVSKESSDDAPVVTIQPVETTTLSESSNQNTEISLPSVVPEVVKNTTEIYISRYIKFGGKNNPEDVKKLQIFLNDFEQEKLSVD